MAGAGSAAAISDPAALRPSLFIDQEGDYAVELTVNDGTADSAPATIRFSTDELTARPSTERSLAGDQGETLVLRPGAFGQYVL